MNKSWKRALRQLFDQSQWRMSHTLKTQDNVMDALVSLGLAEVRKAPFWSKNGRRVLAMNKIYRISEAGRQRVLRWNAEAGHTALCQATRNTEYGVALWAA